MTTWLIDTALFKAFGSTKATPVRNWLDAHGASVFLSAASLVEIAAAITKMPPSQMQRQEALQAWLDGLATRYAGRIHPIDPQIALRAGALMANLQIGYVRHRFHDAVLVATAQIHGHGLVTRRDAIFGPWAEVPMATP